MQLGLILLRMWRERRLVGVLLLAMCLVTAFLALGPLYVRAVAGADFDIRVQQASSPTFTIDLSNSTPLGTDADQLITDILGDSLESNRAYTLTTNIVCGFQYVEDEPLTDARATTDFSYCFRPIAYNDFDTLFTLVEGRLPQEIEGKVEVTQAQVEVVVTRATADNGGLRAYVDEDGKNQYTPLVALGNRFIIGTSAREAVTVEIVGIVEPTIPADDAFWRRHLVIEGEWEPITPDITRFNFVPIVTEQAYDTWIQPLGDTLYMRRIQLNRDTLSADKIDELLAQLDTLSIRIRDIYPTANTQTTLTDFIAKFQQSITQAEGPIILLSALVMTLMLYNLVTIVSLILEQQSEEWALIASRGGSALQIVRIQFVTVGILGIIAFIMGPLIAQILLKGMAIVGPQSAILKVQNTGSIPTETYILSFVASLAAVIVLTYPAWPIAHRSLAHLKQSISRPPERPLWARYYLDFILLIVAGGFLARLYSLASANYGLTTEAFLQDPGLLIRLIAAEGDTEGLRDPFNIAGPALLVVGAALLWMRVFPLVMRMVGRLFDNLRGLIIRLALWNVERDPGHYAQLVILLIGTLALGTASLSLTVTRETGVWETAYQQAGGDAQINLNPIKYDGSNIWSQVEGVEHGASVMVTTTASRIAPPVSMFGVNVKEITTAFPELEASLAPLASIPDEQTGGLVIPETLSTLSLDVYVTTDDRYRDITTDVILEAVDQLGVPIQIQMMTSDNTAKDRFITYSATLDTTFKKPLSITGVRFVIDEFEPEVVSPQIYLDNLRGETTDDSVILLDSFEQQTLDNWAWSGSSNQLERDQSVALSTEQQTEGDSSLALRLRITRVSGPDERNPILNNNFKPYGSLPVIVSTQYADTYGRRNEQFERPLELGDEVITLLEIPTGLNTPVRRINLTYHIVGIIDTFPTMDADGIYLIADLTSLRARVNSVLHPQNYMNYNQIWLDLTERQPTDSLREQLASLPDAIYTRFAWDTYAEIQREPLANAITGILFAGFWVSLGLSLLDFAFYMAITVRRRAMSFAVLRAIGWKGDRIWQMLSIEQAAFITPALLIGVLLGNVIAYLILPFLAISGNQPLIVPVGDVIVLLIVMVGAFSAILGATAIMLRRISLNEIIRFGE